MVLLLQTTFHFVAGIFAAAAQQSIYNDTVSIHMNTISSLSKHKSARRMSGMHSAPA